MAPNILASCRGCLHMLKRWDGKNMNDPFIGAASSWFRGQTLRQKLQPSRWWDSEPPGRRSKGSTMKCTSKRLLGPPPYGPEWMEALDQEICFLGRADMEEAEYRQARRGSGVSCCKYFVAQLPDQIPLQDPSKE